LMVEAAARASDAETELGSLRKLAAVCSAACFWAKVVPSAGTGAGAAADADAALDEPVPVPRRAKRDWSSLSCEVFAGAGAGERAGDAGLVGFAALAGLLIPSAGTEIPAAPRRSAAPVFK
jgi:hypothetical protein